MKFKGGGKGGKKGRPGSVAHSAMSIRSESGFSECKGLVEMAKWKVNVGPLEKGKTSERREGVPVNGEGKRGREREGGVGLCVYIFWGVRDG